LADPGKNYIVYSKIIGVIRLQNPGLGGAALQRCDIAYTLYNAL
jgi:hypothetical protein